MLRNFLDGLAQFAVVARRVPILFAVMAAATTATASPAEQRIDALAFGCDFTGAKTVEVSMGNAGVKWRETHVPAAQTADGGLRFSFTAPPGPLYIDYSVDGQKCMDGGEGLIVLPGHDRHILISMQPGLHVRDWHARKFVAGTMPAVPIGVSVVASDSPGCPSDVELRTLTPFGQAPEIAATVDGGAYYVGYVYARHMFLKLISAGFDTLFIALPDAIPVESHDQYVRRDITDGDLRKLTTHADMNQPARCIHTPSGTSMRFP